VTVVHINILNKAEQIREMVMHTNETVRDYESDCLGFSEELHRYSPKDGKRLNHSGGKLS
jgi:hypothetical protein